MTDSVGLSLAAGVALALMTAAYSLRAVYCRANPARESEGVLPLTLWPLLSYLVPSVTVLLLTYPALVLCRLSAAFSAWMAPHPDYVKAWFVFWFLMLLLDGCEFALRLLFALRKKPFPLPSLIRNILHSALVVGALLLVAKLVLTFNISTALASTALLTAVVGFALQGVLGNLLAGMSMHIVRSSVPGDWVAIGDIEGEVIETNWRETRLRTVGGHMLVVPNSKVAESVIHNMTYPTPLRRIRISVGASYSDAPADVIAALEASALSVPDVLRDPRPSAVLTEYKDFGINYDLRFWTTCYFNRSALISDVQSRIWYQFKRRGIEIPFPMSDKLLNDFMEVVYHQRTLPPDDKQVEQHLSDLLQSDFCRKLLVDSDGRPLVTEDELRPVARTLRRTPYTRGETLFTQGDPGETAYVLTRGTLTGRIDFQSDMASHTFVLETGALLGEMSLVTGLPRTATLQAADEVEVLEIPKSSFVALLSLRPDIPAKLAELVSQRAQHNAAVYEKLKAMPHAEITASLQRDSILKRFKRLLRSS